MGKVRDYSLNFLNSAIGTAVAYNLSGLICNEINSGLDTNIGFWPQTVISIPLFAGGAILGYKARGIVKKIKPRFRRAKARTSFLEEVVKEENAEFLERQGIKKGTLGKIRGGLRYLLTVPLGGALGYIPGLLGIMPLCVHFGELYKWDSLTSLASGAFAGSVVGSYALGEMTAKRQYEKLITTASALIGASAAGFIPDQLGLRMLDSIPDMYEGLGITLAGAVVVGVAGNLAYRGIKKLVQNRKKRRMERELSL